MQACLRLFLSLLLTLVFTGVPISSALADVIIIDPQGGPGAALLKQAITDAQDGDVLLLREGQYVTSLQFDGLYRIAGKSITIMGDNGYRPEVRGITSSSSPPGTTVILRGLDIIGGHGLNGAGPALSVIFSDGSIRVEDCVIRGAPGVIAGDGTGSTVSLQAQAAVRIFNSPSATFVRCELIGGRGGHADLGMGLVSTDGAHGLHLSRTPAAFLDCVVTGGEAGHGFDDVGFLSDGGHGMFLESATVEATTVLVSGCEVRGGDSAPDGGRAGQGLQLTDPHATVWKRDSNFSGGLGIGSGTPGLPALTPVGVLLTLSAAHRSFALSSPLRGGDLATLEVDGEPGDLVLAAVGLDIGLLPLFGEQGMLMLDLATLVYPVVIGTLPGPDGQLSVDFPMPSLLPGLDGLVFHTQGVFITPSGALLGDGSAALWLEDGF